MDKTNIWSRMGHWFKRTARPDSFDSGEAAHVTPRPRQPESGPGASNQVSPVETAPDDPAEAGALARFRLSRGSSLERLEEEYKRIVGLIDEIQAHMSAQQQRTGAMAGSLETLVTSLRDLPALSQQQVDVLGQLQETASSQHGSMKRLEGELAQLPRLADAQREALVAVDRKLAESRQTSARMADALDALRSAVGRMSEASETSGKVLEKLHWDITAREDRMADLIEHQTQRLTILATAVGAVVLIGMIVGLFALFR
jgi:hypothetical protein